MQRSKWKSNERLLAKQNCSKFERAQKNLFKKSAAFAGIAAKSMTCRRGAEQSCDREEGEGEGLSESERVAKARDSET